MKILLAISISIGVLLTLNFQFEKTITMKTGNIEKQEHIQIKFDGKAILR